MPRLNRMTCCARSTAARNDVDRSLQRTRSAAVDLESGAHPGAVERTPSQSRGSVRPAPKQVILRREAAKKRRIKPLRKLFAEIPRLITELKPCLLMSPISVASVARSATCTNSIWSIFDEASQIAPEEAAGAIMRGAQMIIVGDTKQLPPTRFFVVVGSDDAEDDLAKKRRPHVRQHPRRERGLEPAAEDAVVALSQPRRIVDCLLESSLLQRSIVHLPERRI